MFPENGNIVAGVSGGPDSVCLLLGLVKLRESCGLRLAAVHVNHGLRAEAGEDAAFVRRLCAQWQVEFVLEAADVEQLARKKGISCEEAGRQVRYRAFTQQLARMDAVTGGHGCIAVAHNRDDRAETFLFHLLRGTGLDGMAGIRPVRYLQGRAGVRIIRPLLAAGRDEIEAFLEKEGIGWRTDATNAQDIYTRNRIRNRILPYAEEHVSRGAKLHLAREAALLEETADFVRGRMLEALERCLEAEETRVLRLSVTRLRKEPPFLQKLVVRECLQRVGLERDLTAAHVEAAWALAQEGSQSGRRLSLPVCRVEAVRVFESLVFRESMPGEAYAGTFIPLKPGRIPVPGLGIVEVRLLPGPAQNAGKDAENTVFFKNIPEKKYTKWLDYGKIIEPAGFRSRLTGDYLTVNDALDRKSLKRYMIDEKIPADKRAKLMLLADGAHIIWVPGHRISAAYKVTAQTAVILEISCNPADGEQDT